MNHDNHPHPPNKTGWYPCKTTTKKTIITIGASIFIFSKAIWPVEFQVPGSAKPKLISLSSGSMMTSVCVCLFGFFVIKFTPRYILLHFEHLEQNYIPFFRSLLLWLRFFALLGLGSLHVTQPNRTEPIKPTSPKSNVIFRTTNSFYFYWIYTLD